MEGPKVLTLARDRGPVLVSADVHGNWDDFARLREIFLSSVGRGEDPVWISVGDWVHGPSDEDRRAITDRDGAPLYDYDDRTPELLRALFQLMDHHPVVSLCGNHEHAHIGGRRTRKFHDDEAAHLESRLPPAEVDELRRRFASWPMVARLPSCGVVVTHGAPSPALDGPADFERVRYAGDLDERAATLRDSAMTHYGFSGDEDRTLLERLRDPGGPPYELLVHGHDRAEEGVEPSGAASLLLCSSFGAPRSRKAYLWLDAARRYRREELREGHEIRFLWS